MSKTIQDHPSCDDFKTMASSMLGLNKNRRAFEQRYRSCFGTTPEVCVELWMRLDPVKHIKKKGLHPKHLLWTLLFLKGYDTETKNAVFVGNVDEKTYRKWVWIFIQEIGTLFTDLVSRLLCFLN